MLVLMSPKDWIIEPTSEGAEYLIIGMFTVNGVVRWEKIDRSNLPGDLIGFKNGKYSFLIS